MKAILSALMLLFATAGAYAEETRFVVAVASEKSAPTTLNCTWNLEIGEAFPFVRYMSASEFNGGPQDGADCTYAVLGLDNGNLVVRSSNLSLVPEADTAKAAMTYRGIVEQFRADVTAHNQRQSQGAGGQQQSPGYIILPPRGPVRTSTVLRDSSGRVANTLEPGRVYHRRAVDDQEEAELIRISQAMERGASNEELAQMANAEEMRKLRDEMERLRQSIPMHIPWGY